MAKKKFALKGRHSIFDRFASLITHAVGSPGAFITAVAIVVIWAVCGPLLQFSETWQLVINTGTTIVTFLMVFLIQQSQNKDSLAVHLKLNELIAATKMASNRTIDVEDLDEADLQVLRRFYSELAELAKKEGGVKTTHSLDDAEAAHSRKRTRSATTRNASGSAKKRSTTTRKKPGTS